MKYAAASYFILLMASSSWSFKQWEPQTFFAPDVIMSQMNFEW